MSEWPLPAELPDPMQPAIVAEPIPEAYPFWGYKDLLMLLVIVFLVTQIGGLAIVALGFIWPSPVLTLLLTQFVVYGAGILVLYGVVGRRYGRPFWQAIRWPAPRVTLLRWATAGIATALLGSLLAAAIGAQDIEQLPMKELLSSRSMVIVVGVLAVTLGPLWEELTFRGFLQPLLAKNLGDAAAILISAGAFSILHGPQYGWDWRALLPVAFAGACFGVARTITGSTGVAAGMHAIYNLTVFSAFLAQGGADNIPW